MSISVFRQLILVLPLAYALSLTGELNMVWWSFPIAEVLAGRWRCTTSGGPIAG